MPRRYFQIGCYALLSWMLLACGHSEPSSSGHQAVNELPVEQAVLLIEDPFIREYVGTIGDRKMNLKMYNWGDGRLDASYHFEGVDTLVYELEGEVQLDERVRWVSSLDGVEQGILEAQLTDLSLIRGEQKKTDGSGADLFEWVLQAKAKDERGWEGIWYKNDLWHRGQVLIGNVGHAGFDFRIEMNEQGRHQLVQGLARFEEHKASFQQPMVEKEICDLLFGLWNFSSDLQLKVYQQSASELACHAEGIDFSGTYDRQFRRVEARIRVGESDPFAVFKTAAQEEAFAAFVGADLYRQFALVMEYSGREEVEVADVGRGLVMGKGWLGNVPDGGKAIILYDKDLNFWAALRAEKPNGQFEYIYRTNVSAWEQRTPAAIKEWLNWSKE